MYCEYWVGRYDPAEPSALPQLPGGPGPLERPLAPAARDERRPLPQLVDERLHALAPARVVVGAALDLRAQNGHFAAEPTTRQGIACDAAIRTCGFPARPSEPTGRHDLVFGDSAVGGGRPTPDGGRDLPRTRDDAPLAPTHAE